MRRAKGTGLAAHVSTSASLAAHDAVAGMCVQRLRGASPVGAVVTPTTGALKPSLSIAPASFAGDGFISSQTTYVWPVSSFTRASSALALGNRRPMEDRGVALSGLVEHAEALRGDGQTVMFVAACRSPPERSTR